MKAASITSSRIEWVNGREYSQRRKVEAAIVQPTGLPTAGRLLPVGEIR